MAHDNGSALGLAFARRMALALACCVGTVILLLPFALSWGGFGAFAAHFWWLFPILLIVAVALVAWEVCDYLRAEWRALG